MGIAAIIGIVSSVIQIARSFGGSEAPQTTQPEQKADRLFAELDAFGRGAIERADLERAFDKIADKTTAGAERLFTRLDADGDGAISKAEFSGSINRLADQLDHHYMRLRLQGDGGPPLPASDAGFSRDALTGLVSGIAENFDRADTDGNGRVSIREMRAYAANDPATAVAVGQTDGDNVETMLQVVRLMQAYGIVGRPEGGDRGNGVRVVDQV